MHGESAEGHTPPAQVACKQIWYDAPAMPLANQLASSTYLAFLGISEPANRRPTLTLFALPHGEEHREHTARQMRFVWSLPSKRIVL